jgi:hypothetical protein
MRETKVRIVWKPGFLPKLFKQLLDAVLLQVIDELDDFHCFAFPVHWSG